MGDTDYTGDYDPNLYKGSEAERKRVEWELRQKIDWMKQAYAADMSGRHLRLETPKEYSHPDMRPALSRMTIAARGEAYYCVMEIREEGKMLGALVMRASNDPATGRLVFEGVSEFDRDQILFD